jgi:hypothetical protein
MEKDKKKGMALLILEKLGKGKAGKPEMGESEPISESEPETSDEGADYAVMADEILSAIADKDAALLGSLLKDFVSACGSSSSESSDEE